MADEARRDAGRGAGRRRPIAARPLDWSWASRALFQLRSARRL